MAYTTPRTAAVDDDFTSAWYNAEVKTNIIWAHDLLLSVGSTFPASPLTGQRFIFLSGSARELFVYDGTNWYSRPDRVDLLTSFAGGATSGSAASLDAYVTPHPLNVAAFMTASVTLQAKIGGILTPGSATAVHLGPAVKTIAAAGSGFSALTNSTGGEITGSAWQEGAWVTLLAPASVIVAVPTLYGYRSGGLEDTTYGPIMCEYRWKK